MPSIEEAYRRACYDIAAYGDACAEYSGDYIAANDARKREASRKAKAAARALALAVLEAVAETEGKGYDRGMGRWECDFGAVRARIKALG